MPGPRSCGSVRLSLPYVYAAGKLKQEVLNHWRYFDWAEPDTSSLQPETTLGRSPPPTIKLFGLAVSARGNPGWNVVTPLTPQPETSLPASPDAPERNFCPLPKGRS